jgi:type I restriction enzyme S subunit
MLDGWTNCTVDDIKADTPNAMSTGPFGSAISSQFFAETGVPVIRGSNLSQDVGVRLIDDGLVFLTEQKTQEFSRSIVRPGDLIFTCWGTIDQVGLIDERARFREYVISNKQMKLTPDRQKTDSLFLYYLFSSPVMRDTILNQGIGSSVPGFNLGQLKAIPLYLPPISEQRAIAHILGTLDDKIELNRRMNETLEAMARAIFKSWFVDFDPVRAKAEGRDPGLPKHIADLFPDRFERSELGDIPAGWKVRSFSEVTAQITKGTTPTDADVTKVPPSDAQINFLRVNAIADDGSILYDKLTRIPEIVHKGVLKRSILRANDVVYTIAGTIGRVAVVEDDLLPANTNQAVAIIRPKPLLVPSDFLVLTFRQQVFQEELHSNIVHAVQANLSLGMISRAKAIFPPCESLAIIFNPVENILRKKAYNRRESCTLEAMRDSLLPKLLSGELRATQIIQTAEIEHAV